MQGGMVIIYCMFSCTPDGHPTPLPCLVGSGGCARRRPMPRCCSGRASPQSRSRRWGSLRPRMPIRFGHAASRAGCWHGVPASTRTTPVSLLEGVAIEYTKTRVSATRKAALVLVESDIEHCTRAQELVKPLREKGRVWRARSEAWEEEPSSRIAMVFPCRLALPLVRRVSAHHFFRAVFFLLTTR